MKEKLPIRKKIRLKYYDYSLKGKYFITICTKNRMKIFGNIKNNQMILTREGNIVQDYIINIEKNIKV